MEWHAQLNSTELENQRKGTVKEVGVNGRFPMRCSISYGKIPIVTKPIKSNDQRRKNSYGIESSYKSPIKFI